MEYYLKHLNKITNLKNLTLTNFIEKLNLIGLEVDEIVFESLEVGKEKHKHPFFLKDICLTLKIPANRDDLLNEVLFTNELSWIFLLEIINTWKKIKENYFFLLKQKYLATLNFSFSHIESELDYFLTYGVEIEDYNKEAKIPIWIKNRLHLNGNYNDQANSIDSIIQLSLLEWGQRFKTSETKPGRMFKVEYGTYPFPVSEIEKDVSIKNSPKNTIILKDKNNQIIQSLGGLKPDSIDRPKPIYGKDPGKNLFIEATFYDIDTNILNLSDLNSMLSYRELRRTFLSNFKFAFQRLLTLLEIIVESSVPLKVYKNNPKSLELITERLLQVDKNIFQKFLKVENYDPSLFERSNIKLVCTTLDSFYFKIPESRRDLKREIDLVEEYSTLIGYRNFKEIQPTILKVKSSNPELQRNEFIKQFFLTRSFTEVYTNSFEPTLKDTIQLIPLQNPLNSELANLRPTLTRNLITVFLKNRKWGRTPHLRFFEIGRIYNKYDTEYSYQEEDFLSVIFTTEKKTATTIRQQDDFYAAKGLVEDFISYFEDKKLDFLEAIEKNDFYHPNKTLQIVDSGKIIGYFGQIHPRYKDEFARKQNVYLFEFNLRAVTLNNLRSNIRVFEDYSKYPSIIRDLSVLIGREINFYDLRQSLLNRIKYVKHISFFDVYFADNEKENKKLTLGIRLEFQSFEKTLKAQEIEAEIEKVGNLLTQLFNAELK